MGRSDRRRQAGWPDSVATHRHVHSHESPVVSPAYAALSDCFPMPSYGLVNSTPLGAAGAAAAPQALCEVGMLPQALCEVGISSPRLDISVPTTAGLRSARPSAESRSCCLSLLVLPLNGGAGSMTVGAF